MTWFSLVNSTFLFQNQINSFITSIKPNNLTQLNHLKFNLLCHFK